MLMRGYRNQQKVRLQQPKSTWKKPPPAAKVYRQRLSLEVGDEAADTGDDRRSGFGLEQYRCANRRDVFLEKTEQIVPWSACEQQVQARLKVGTRTIVDATIINASDSSKNADNARHPERR